MPLTPLNCPNCDGLLHTDDLLENECVTPGCGHRFSKEFYEEENVSKGYWPRRMLLMESGDVINSILQGQRNPIQDADEVVADIPNEGIEAIHDACDSRVVLKFDYTGVGLRDYE